MYLQKEVVHLRMQLNSCTGVPALNMGNSWNFWRTMTQIQPYPDISHREREHFWQNSTQAAGLYFKDAILKITEQLLSWKAPLSPQKHRQKLSHQISCFCPSYSSLCALSRNATIHLFLFPRVIYTLLLSQHKEWKSKPTIFYCLLSCSLARPLWPQLLVISGSQFYSHQKPVEKAYRCMHIVASTIMQ